MEAIAGKIIDEWSIFRCPLVIKHRWLENEPFIGDVPIKISIQLGDFPAMLDYQRVIDSPSTLRASAALLNAPARSP